MEMSREAINTIIQRLDTIPLDPVYRRTILHLLREAYENGWKSSIINEQSFESEVERLKEELKVTDYLLEQRNKVLEAIPECPAHGNQCIPHAMEWIMNKATEHQPNPKSEKVRVLDLVRKDLEARAEAGNERYGTYLQTHNGRDAMWDLYQELLDASMYVRQVIGEKPIYYIWWTSQRACRELDELDLSHLPAYIQTEFTSRNGRNGRGRLWVADHIGIKEIEWLEKPGAWLAGDCGGVVIEARDLEAVFSLPGFVTDLELNVVNEP